MWLIIGAAYAAPIILYLVTTSPIDRIMLAILLILMVAPLTIPLTGRLAAPNNAKTLFKGIMAALILAGAFSLWSVPLTIPLALDSSKYVGSGAIFFSLIPVIATPVRLAAIAGLLKTKGISGLQTVRSTAAADHFALEYSTQQWFRHGHFASMSIICLALYLGGWYLLGLPMLLYAISFFIFTTLILRRLAVHFVGPFDLAEVNARMEPTYFVKATRPYFGRPSREASLVITCILTLAAFVNLVEGPLQGANLLILLLLVVLYAASLLLYIWRTGTHTRPFPATA